MDAITEALSKVIEEASYRAARRAAEEQHIQGLTGALEAIAEKRLGDINPWKPYTVRETAPLLGISQSRVYDIPEEQLRPTWTGPTKGRKCFLGINIICYIAGIEPVDVETVARRERERFVGEARRPAKVHSLPNAVNEKTRIL